jgi:hemoglobin/transferrin/lactoferrin receptor protein
LGLGYREPTGAFGGELIFSYNAQKEFNETTGVCSAACFRPDESLIVDATAYVRIAENFKLRAGIFNITDKKYWVWSSVRGLEATSPIIDAFTQPGRNASVSLSISF